MNSTPKYTIAMSNYNMVDTIEDSICSILDKCGDDFEVVVVDGGSNDGSTHMLSQLETNNPRLQVIYRDKDSTRLLGADRQHSVEAARGEYTITHIDSDDILSRRFDKLLKVYHDEESEREDHFAMCGGGVMIAPTELFGEYPYRNLSAGEDQDLWRRLLSDGRLVWYDTDSFIEPIGYSLSGLGLLSRWYDSQVSDFRAGLSAIAYIIYLIKSMLPNNPYGNNYPPKETIAKLTILPFAYLKSMRMERLGGTPQRYKIKGNMDIDLTENTI